MYGKRKMKLVKIVFGETCSGNKCEVSKKGKQAEPSCYPISLYFPFLNGEEGQDTSGTMLASEQIINTIMMEYFVKPSPNPPPP